MSSLLKVIHNKDVYIMKNLTVSVWETAAAAPLLLLISVLSFGLLGLAFGIGLGVYTFILGLLFCLVPAYFCNKQFFKMLLITFLMLAGWVIICGLIFDWSYDAMYFHKQAIIALKEGWNPFYEGSQEATVFASYPDMALWLDNYPNGSWILSAVIYSITNRLETAKAVNLLYLMPVYALGVDVLQTVYGTGKAKSLLWAVLLIVNPVFVCQLFTSYNDLPVGAFMILTILACIKIVNEKATFCTYFILFAELAFACTVKFTAPILCALSAVPFGVYYAWKKRDTLKQLFRPVAVVLAGFIIGGFILGFHPYVTHIMEGKHVIYPVMGEGSYDIMNTNPPKGFEEKSNPEKLFISLFSKTNNNITDEPELKVPFCIYSSEWIHLSNADIRIGGFGVLFSGILLMSIFIGIIALIDKRKIKASTILVLSLLFVLALFFPESWWARYSCFTYYLPVFCCFYALDNNKMAIVVLRKAAYTLFLLNAALFLVCVLKTGIEVTAQLNHKLSEIKEQDKKIIVRVNDFPSHVKLFEEYGIDYEVSHTALPEPEIFYRNTKYQFIKE